MVLRKLSIFGFKSFYDKTEITFGDGLTSIIGPNGCGKSNVVDAVRWVFGEQKASMLRSANMQDVIFSGTQNRQPLNMAEVTITIENTRGILPLEYNEVAITRRVYRSGESEYLINKTPCRLKDIQGMFLDTGVGSNAYTTIENNMINKILSDKAEERRILFEEAAGIGKYKQKIRESTRKLDRTNQDLLRINDRIQEKDRYVRMLARQVEKARRFQRYRDDLKGLEVGFENRRYQDINEIMEQRKAQLEEMEAEYETLVARTATVESKIEKMEIEKIERENDLSIASQNVAAATDKIQSTDREISMATQNLEFQHENVTRFERETESFEGQMDEKQNLVSNIEKSLVERESTLEEHIIRVDGAQGELGEFDSRLSAFKESTQEMVERQLSIVHSVGEKQRLLSNCQTNLSNSLERQERNQREIRSLETRIEEYRDSLSLCKEQLESENTAYKNHSQSREVLWSRIEKEDERYHEFVEREKRLEAKIDASKAQLKFLKGLDAAFDGYESGVKALLAGKFEGRLGILADCIEVEDPTAVGLVEKVMGSAIQTVVFKTNSDLKHAVEYLSAKDAGMARMISLEACNSQPPQKLVSSTEDISPLADYVKTSDEYSNLVGHMFNAISLCQSEDTIYQNNGEAVSGSVMISRSGLIRNSNGTIVAGGTKSSEPGILQRKQEIEKLTAGIEIAQQEYEVTVHEKENCIINRDEAKLALVEVDEKLNRGRQRQQEQETNIKHYENEIHNIQDRVQLLHPELMEVTGKISEFEQQIEIHTQEIEDIASTRVDLEQQIESARGRLTEMEGERIRLADHLKNVELAMHGLRNRIEQDKQSIISLNGDIENFAKGKQTKLSDKNKALIEISNLEEKIVVLKDELEKQLATREELEKILGEKREVFTGIINEIEELRKVLKVDQGDLGRIGNQKHELEISQTRDDEHKRSIREKIYTAYEIDLEAPPEDVPLLDKEDADVTENIHMLKERLKRVGEVNLGAPSEYETENGELKEMVAQRDDLQTAVDDLERAIRKLNKEARVQFVETFSQVQKNFTAMFTTLFEGGEAKIELDENADPLDAAIQINVRPAGKKMRGVTLLSGGERALTAISLLFALYMVKPSAYCILDELDAPLDDANVERFLRILRKFSGETQFIIVTHNKKTMEAADVLYGVTQQESGVSIIASVKLREAILKAA